jgi:hypothetical protein
VTSANVGRTPVLALVVALVVTLSACGDAASSAPAAPANPSATVRDETFALTLAADRPHYRPTDAISVAASYAYLGPRVTERAFHAAQAIGFRIEEIGGQRGMGGGMDMPCLFTDVAAGQPVAVPFAKAGVISDDPNVGFDAAWFQDPVFRLPAGRWRVVATLGVSLSDCGGEAHALEASVEVVVEP